jgi:ferric-dicitrate binding protein FerR (iron transport regulator)
MKDTSTNKNSNSSLIRILLRKVQSNNLSDKEIQVLGQLKKEYPHVQSRKKISLAQLNRAVDRNRKAILQKGVGLPSSKERNPIRFNYIMAAVAAVMLLLLVFTLYNKIQSPAEASAQELVLNDHSDHRLTTEKNMKRVTLADGSMVFMNSGTSLSLRKGKFNAHTREVWLEEGEAFFQITRDTSRPFIVHTRNGVSTQVLGTSFNIKSYAELSDQVISVNTGKVQVMNARQEKIILEPDYKVSISGNDGSFTPGKTDAQSASDWRTGRIVLENASLKEVSFRLRQQYDIELVYDEDRFRNELIYTSFTTETPLQEVLVVLGKLLNADYTVDHTKVYLKKLADQQK